MWISNIFYPNTLKCSYFYADETLRVERESEGEREKKRDRKRDRWSEKEKSKWEQERDSWWVREKEREKEKVAFFIIWAKYAMSVLFNERNIQWAFY